MNKLPWLLPLLGAVFGALTIAITLLFTRSAPQEAAGYALACALAVVPYVLVRAVMEMTTTESAELKELRRIVDALQGKRSD